MRRTLLALGIIIATSTTAAADIDIADNDQTIAVDCAKDKNVAVAGNNAKLTLTGTCASISLDGNGATVSGTVKLLSINGNDNIVTLVGLDSLSVNGNTNKVTWKKPVSKKKTLVSNSGNGNKLKRVK